MRTEEVYRKTKETEVKVKVNLDGEGKICVDTGVPFLDHMIASLATHSLIDINASVKGDLVHHMVEDLAIGLGEALNKALGTREGITRFGNAAAPMDCSLAFAAVDLVKRPYFKIDLKLRGKKVEEHADRRHQPLLRILRHLSAGKRPHIRRIRQQRPPQSRSRHKSPCSIT